MRAKRIILSLSLIIVLIFVSVLPVFAAETTYEPSSQYKSSVYYDNFRKLPEMGGRASDVLAIALSQLGYHEGNSNADLGGGNLSGTRDFVEYNVLYGKLDNNQGNGVSYGYYWCASFVNWCLRQANVSKEASAGAFVSCWKWREATINAGIYNGKNDYAPQSGDIVFFNDGESYVASSHIGFVLYSDSSKVYTIEGNTSNGSEFSKDGNYVALKSYSLTSPYIVGYATPRYAAETETVDHSGKILSAGQYISTSDIDIYPDAKMNEKSTTLSAFEVFSVKEIKDDVFRIYYGNDGDEGEGYANIRGLAKQLNVDNSVYKVKFVDTDDSELFDTVYRLAESDIEIPNIRPQKENCGFVGWVNLSEGEQEAKIICSGDVLDGCAQDLVFQALWDTNLYTVSFFDEDGKLLHEEKGYYGDTLPQMMPARIPEGYLFESWVGDGDPVLVKGNASYVAKYVVDKDFVPLVKEEPVGCLSSANSLAPMLMACIVFCILGKRK